jgi:DNA polymerase I
MLVGQKNFDAILDQLKNEPILTLDTEATGLYPYLGDSLFSIIIRGHADTHYFNFNPYPGLDDEFILPRRCLQGIARLGQNPSITWVMANAKYDLHMLSRAGIEIAGDVWDVLVMARIENNTHLSYSLSSCGERIGVPKSEAVEEYIAHHRLWEWVSVPGKKTRSKKKYFDKVPLEIIQPYAEQDAEVTFKLYEHQKKVFAEWDKTPKPISPIVNNEVKLTKVCFEMEKRGILLDKDYCAKAIKHEEKRAEEARRVFKASTGVDFVDSAKTFRPVFQSFGIAPGVTEKGNDSFTDNVLSAIKHPIARCIQDHRDAAKRANTYYKSFVFHGENAESVVHPNFRQSATTTGRFSITEPALQTLNNEEKSTSQWKVKKSFKARPGFNLCELDYKNMEFRAAIDQAEELEMASKIAAGHDPHQAAADEVGIGRYEAKTLNFLVLYGGGEGKLAESLQIPLTKAREVRQKYFTGLPRLRATIRNCAQIATERGWIYNRYGRRYFFPDEKFAYKAFNAWCQGSCADAVKIAMVKLHEFLQPNKSRMVLQIHDSILFEIAFGEEHLLTGIVEIMKSTWEPKCLGMDVSMKTGENWGELG